MTFKTALVACLLVVLTGCQAVSYQPAGFRGGYSERLLEDGRYRVLYSGNGSVTLEKAIDFAMLRSAVLAKQNGADYFETTEHTAKVSRVDLGAPGVYRLFYACPFSAFSEQFFRKISLTNDIFRSRKIAICTVSRRSASTFYRNSA